MELSKKRSRLVLRVRREKLSDLDVKSKSREITNRLKETINWKDISSMHTYLPIQDNKEVDTWGILRWIWRYHPKISTSTSVYGETRALRHVLIDNRTKFKKDSMGIPMPIENYQQHEIDYDIVIVPVLGFDEKLNRIGYGSGVYDSFLSNLNSSRRIGVSYETGRLDSIPTEAHDERMDLIITENAVYE